MSRKHIVFTENESTEVNGQQVAKHRKSNSVTVKSKNSEQFFMTYTKFMAPLLHIKSANDSKVLGMLCKLMDYNSGKVYLNTDRREDICRAAEIVPSVLSRSIKSLKDLGLISDYKGTIEISPFIFWKGNSEDREKHLLQGGEELRVKFKIDPELESGSVITPNYSYDG